MLTNSKQVIIMSIRSTYRIINNNLRCYLLTKFTPVYGIVAALQEHADYCMRADRSHHRQMSSNPPSRKLPVLTLYTKQHCTLCDEALHHLEPFLDQVVLEKVDITTPENRAWWKLYRCDIPVFHLDGRYLMKHKADLDVFKTAVSDFHNNSTTSENSVQ